MDSIPIICGMVLPGMIPRPPGLSVVNQLGNTVIPANPFFFDLDADYGGIPRGPATPYVFPVDSMSAQVARAWKLRYWNEFTVKGSVTMWSDRWFDAGGGTFVPTDPGAGRPAGYITIPLPSVSLALPSGPPSDESLGIWARGAGGAPFVAGGTEPFFTYDWTGKNSTGNFRSEAVALGHSLDWQTPLSPMVGLYDDGSVAGRVVGATVPIGTSNIYPLGETPTPDNATPVPQSLYLRAAFFGNCGCVRYQDGEDGVWQYPIITGIVLRFAVEPDVDPGPGEYFNISTTLGYFGTFSPGLAAIGNANPHGNSSSTSITIEDVGVLPLYDILSFPFGSGHNPDFSGLSGIGLSESGLWTPLALS